MTPLTRRAFLQTSAKTLAALHLDPPAPTAPTPTFRTADTPWQQTYDAALRVLAGNVRVLPRYPHPVLLEGANYPGIWQECGPHEALVYRRFRPDVARHSHLTFFALQRPDGQLPANNKLTEAGFGQIQMVVPIAATAWELAQATGESELLDRAYTACAAWDAWLLCYRNTRRTGLVEGFCTYDTGQDNSPRWAGIPNQCPDKDARRCPPIPSQPRLCPDLSATVYGARVALAAMARALGRPADEDRWLAFADQLRQLILTRLYVDDDTAFYDLDAQNHFVRIRCAILTTVCGEHVPDQPLFDRLWARQLGNPQAFWPAYPLPSVAINDPLFVRPIPPNSWGGASQALTALRATRWFDHYNRPAELATLMQRWCDAILRDPTFLQQLDPLTGDFTPTASPGYSPAALAFFDFTWRLAGITEDQNSLHWNVRPNHPAALAARFNLTTDAGQTASLAYTATGATLTLAGRQLARLTGGTVRLVTNKDGNIEGLTGIAETPQTIQIHRPGHPTLNIAIKPNQRWALAAKGDFTPV